MAAALLSSLCSAGGAGSTDTGNSCTPLAKAQPGVHQAKPSFPPCLVINSVRTAPLHQILVGPVRWRWEVTAHFCYCHWMAIDVKQRSLCTPHMHWLCSTSLFRVMAMSARPADTREVQSPQAGSSTTSKTLAGVGLNTGFSFMQPFHAFPALKINFCLTSSEQTLLMSNAKYLNAMERGEKTPGGITVPCCEIVKAYIETDG